MGYLLNGVEDGGCPLHLVKKIIEGFEGLINLEYLSLNNNLIENI